jgi:exosortase
LCARANNSFAAENLFEQIPPSGNLTSWNNALMNESKSKGIDWKPNQIIGVIIFGLILLKWSDGSAQWKVTLTGQLLYIFLLFSFCLILHFFDPKVWVQIPCKIFFFTLLILWIVLFQFWGNSILGYVHTASLFGWLYNLYNLDAEQNDSYGNIIPFLVVAIFWWKRKELLALPLALWWPGLLLLAAAILLHIFGYLVQQPVVSVVALFLGIYALTGLAWGSQWLRRSYYPFFLFVFSIPMTAHLSFILFPLQLLMSWLVEMVTHLIGLSVIRHGTQLVDPSGNYGYDVAAACAGMRSLIAIVLLATVIAFGTLRGAGKRIFLIALAVPFSVLGNMLRLLAIIFAAEMGGQKWGDYIHEGGPLGLISLLPYVPGILGLLWIGLRLEKCERKIKQPPTRRYET